MHFCRKTLIQWVPLSGGTTFLYSFPFQIVERDLRNLFYYIHFFFCYLFLFVFLSPLQKLTYSYKKDFFHASNVLLKCPLSYNYSILCSQTQYGNKVVLCWEDISLVTGLDERIQANFLHYYEFLSISFPLPCMATCVLWVGGVGYVFIVIHTRSGCRSRVFL